MNEKVVTISRRVQEIFSHIDAIKLAYVFGSRALATVGPLSDYDFAFYLDASDKKKRFDIRLELVNQLSKILKTDKVDTVILNDVASPELKYSIIKDGILIYEKEPYKILIEPRILNEYFDFRDSLRRYGLTKA